MDARRRRTAPSLVAGVVFAVLAGCVKQDAHSQSRHRVTRADIERWHEELSNWRRWGPDDQLGALNLITPEKRRQAVALVRAGISVSLARNTEKDKAADNDLPFQHTMLATGEGSGQWCADSFSISHHGYAHTHMDALCHIFYRGRMYNGFSREEVSSTGAAKLGIENLKNGILTRGILIDIPRLKGVEYLEPRTAIYAEDLEAWETRAGVRVSSGDVLFIRTGRWARRARHGPWDVETEGSAGLHASCAKWLRKRDVAMIGSDAAADVLPSGIDGITHPIHLLCLNAMGVHIFDNCDLETLGKMCASQKRWHFLLTAAPLAVVGGTGSPLNPIASF